MDRSPGGADMILEDFGQRVDLTRRIREVLVNYPEGTTVLKELIQNADDAGATKVFLCLDRRFHGVDSLLSSELSQFQGPALLAYNDAVFTEDDFVSISRIGDSKKHTQAWKTGRFGVGFNSVYHLTDLPSFVSNKYVVLFDPHGSYLPNVSAANPGKRLDFVSSSAMPLYEDQFKPYRAFGCDMKNPFPGTLFRFPLRNADQAAVSKLSKQAYTADDISFMFSEIYEEAVFSLLFLKNIISIEMYVWEAGVSKPHKVYSCSVRESKEKIAQNRRALLRLYSSTEVSDCHLDSFLVNFLCEAITGGNSESRVETFFIVQGMASTSSRLGAFAAMAAKEFDLHLLPWASVALCLSDDLPEDHVLKQGQVFCSLPLPVRTGFNVHVNGYFEVYSNRRSIWFGSDLDRGGKLRSDWNRLLLQYVVAPAYCELLVGLCKLLGPTKQYYSAWPTGLFEEPWSILVENIYRIAYSAKVLYSNFEGGNWISPAEAFFHDVEFSKIEILGEALVLLGMPIVYVPNIIFETMCKYWSNLRIRLVSPVIVRSILKESGKLSTLNKSYKLVLLEYCLTDLSNEDVAKHVEGLALLPLANDEFGTFTKTMKGTNYFICSDLEYSILGLAPDVMIDRTIPSDLFSSLSEIAKSSQTNLAFLNEKYFLQLFPRIFPVEWRYKNRVPWNPGVGTSHPTATWFTCFWDYIQGQSYDISTFGEWPMLPSTSGYLYRTSKTSKFINAEKLSETLRELLVKIGCKILNPAYKIKHRHLSLYVSDSDAGCILSSIFDTVTSGENEIWLLFQVLSVPEKIELSRFLLDPKWYHGGFLSDFHIKNAKKLPIYRVYGEQHVENIHFYNLENPTRYLPPVDIPECFLDGDFVFCSSIIEEEILLRYFGIERMPKSAFYGKYVLSRLGELQSDIRDAIMLSVLKELPQLCLDDSSLKESLRVLKFIPTVSGNLDCPESLYDPRVDELYALLEESNCFPGGLFCEHSVLDMLLCLGLRTSVSADTIIKSARHVESLMREDQLKAYLHGKVLLSYLEVHANKWFYNNDSQKGVNMIISRVYTSRKCGNFPSQDGIEKFWNDLRMICWCPVLDSSPHAALPWPVVSSMVAPPKIVRPMEDIWLVSASSRILDGECRSFALASSLGWSSPPSGSVIAAQLLELGKNNEIVVDQVLRQELAIAMPKIYSLLTNLIGSDEMDIVKAILEGCRWIWVGDGFSTVSEVVLSGQFHLAPYIRVIPVDLAVFRDLFLELGIPEYLKPADFANILCRMADKKGCAPLDAEELRAAVSMAQHLAEIQFQHLDVKIYLPDFLSKLIPATDLVYNDAPWLLDLGMNTSADGSSVSLKPKNIHNFVHANISNDVAEKLGVRSLRRRLLAESSDSMNVSLSGVAEAFGQHEALTTRLKHIVEMYADGPGILFELVQNAEDAQASEVVFLLDKTQYGTSSILSPQMAEWQGPALYCFNDSVFSSQDLYAISRIGQDSKLDKPFAIGRFGLGFNCVYHFTDVPGFVSGENIVIFDPHASHLPGISPSHPGLRIKFAGRRILEQFPDQFRPFLHFGCDLQQPFPGTLFRFPLRNETAAHRSQIKKEKYSPEDVELLFSSFIQVVSESLLFLHNIQRVTIFIKDGSGLEMQLIHRLSRHSGGGLGKEPQPHRNLLNFVHGNQQNGMDRDQFMAKLDKIAERDLPWNCQKIILLEQSLSGSHLHVWVVNECIGGGRAKSKSLSVGNQSFKFMPWASVACYLHSASLQDLKDDFLDTKVESYACLVDLGQMSAVHYRKNFMGRAFCFLPLPINTGLPTHINAYFELSSNRRDIWFGDDMSGGGKVRSEWNLCLLEDVIAPAYGRLMVFIAQEVGPCDLYFSFWPTSTGLEPWESMMRKFYVFLSDQRLSVLYTKARGGQWISARQAIFPDFTFPNAIKLAEVLSEAGLPVADVSNEIVKRFMDSCPSLHFLTPHFLRSILIRHHYGFKKKDAIVTALDYCLSDYKVISSCGSLNGLSLLPLANGKFTSFNKRGEGDRVFVTSTEVFDLLVDSVPYLLVDCSIPDNTLNKLRDIANSGLTNLHIFKCYSLVELLPRILPTEWQYARHVRWTPGHLGQPSFEWMGLFWSYLKASCNDLSIFKAWPILPVKNGFLLQLVENSAVIRDDGWSENMSSLLQKLGCSFLSSDFPLDHPHLRNFVWDATATGILNALQASCQLQDIKNLFLNASKAEMRELRSFIFQSRWFSGDQMGSMQIDVIKHLPIFESYKNEGLLTLANPLKSLKPVDVLEDLVDDNFIRTESDREKSILQNHLGIRELPKAEFYKNFVFHRIESFLVGQTILSTILVDVKLLAEEDDSIKSFLSEMPFVLASDGSWRHPSRLYDPRVPILQDLLNKEVFFPCDKFSNSEILDILTSFGLRNSLNLSGLIDVAWSVSMLHDCGHVDAPQYGRKLLSYLNALGIMLSNSNGHKKNHNVDHQMLMTDGIPHAKDPEVKIDEGKSCEFDKNVLSFLSSFVLDKQECEFWSEIKIIPWCPVYVTPLLTGLPWFASDRSVATPDTTRPKSQMWQVSSKMRILDGDCFSTYVQDKLGWMDPPDIETLSTQLVALSKSYNQLKLQSEHEFHIDDILQREMPPLYSKLQDYIDKDDFKVLREALDGINWVWIGDGFVQSKSVAFDSPVKYHPYLYAVPSELSEFRSLLSQLGVRLTFDVMDYLHVLQCLQQDVKGEPLLVEQLSFVQYVLEAFADSLADRQSTDTLLNSLLIPNSSGILMNPSNLVYNDAPWIDINSTQKHFVHSDISNDLAKRLGVQSLQSLSLVDEKTARDFSCLDYARITDLLALYGESDFLLFDLLELADYLQAKKFHLIYDKRQHPRQSLLQHNLSDFQGSALTVVLEGASLSIEEVRSLQLPPPWKIRGNSLNYGLGLVGSYFICDIMTMVSGGYFFIFDPLGLVLTAPSSGGGPSAKLFTLIENDLTERFPDQFSPLLMNQGFCSLPFDSTFIRMPLSLKGSEENGFGCKRVMQIFNRFMNHASSALLSLKSVFQVSLSTWEEGSLYPFLDYSVSIDPAASIMRNPFSEKKWKKFQLSRIFSTSPDAIKIRVLDIHITHGVRSFVDKWIVVLCLGSGKSRNMALDRRYLSHNLTPFAGVAAHISQNGQPISPPASSCILSPLPLSGVISMPVTVLGCFLISHIGGRYLFSHSHGHVFTEQANAKDSLAEAWNKELLLCIRDSYVQLVLEFQKIRKDYLTSSIESNSARALSYILQAYGDRIYSFWPRSKKNSKFYEDGDSTTEETITSEADWASLVEQVIRPFYDRLVDMPVWQLYCGNVVKADEGMFLSQLGGKNGDNLPPARVCSFIKERYPVFSMPSELVKEIQAIGVKVREITPKMIRGLLKSSVSVLPEPIEMYIDVLDYCLSDIQMPDLSASELSGFNNRLDSVGALQTVSDNSSISATPFLSSMNVQRTHRDAFQSSSSSGGDALEVVTYFGKALYDFGRGVVEDIGKAAGPPPNVGTASGKYVCSDGSFASILAELKGLPFPTSTKCLLRLGIAELLIGSKEQQLFMHPLADKFVHTLCLEKSFLAKILSTQNVHGVLKLKSFTPQLVSDHLRLLLTESWVVHVLSVNQAPWVPWDNTASSVSDGPRPEWIRLFWKIFRDIKGDLSLISDWPLIPAVLNRPILCRVKESRLIFIPPIPDPSHVTFDGPGMINSSGSIDEELNKLYLTEFEMISSRYPWLMSLLYQLSIPIYDMSFLDSGASCYFFPTPGQSLGHAIVSKLLAAKHAGSFSVPFHLSDEDRDRLFTLFASDHKSPSCCSYKREELDVLKELPIYKTVTGSYTMIVDSNKCTISPTAFFHPKDEQCLSHSADANQFLHALGVDELTDQEVFVRFALPDFEAKTSAEREEILLYLYLNWKDLQLDSTIVNNLKETNFVRTANEVCTNLFKPRDLLDPHDSLLSSVFSGERSKFPGERFTTDGWLRILRKTGLRTSSQGDMITECARKIELLGCEAMAHAEDLASFETELPFRKKEVSLEIWSLAESVVVTIIANLSSFFNNDFCDIISNIAFVPAEKGLPMIGGKKGGNRVLCTYREAILSKDWPLAWSTAPILVKLNVVPPEFSWGAFHLRSPPPFSTVLKHLLVVGRNNGEDTLSRWPRSLGMMTVEDAFFEILKYLDTNWGARSSSDIRELQKVPFIPVANGTRFVTATSLFVRLTINLSPFAFELPSIYLPFVKILKEIGVQEVLTVDHAKDLIMNIQKSCGYQHLNPNELRAVMEILNFICSSSIKSSADRSEYVFDHIVPDDGCRLVSANSCVYVDFYGSQFLTEIDTSRIRFCHPELPENICVTLGIKKVSDVVIEELDEPQLQVVDQIGSVPLNKIKNKLLSKQLQHALWKLIDGMKVHSPSFEGMNLEHLERSLGQVAYKLQFVRLLHTRFLLLPNNVDITRIPKGFAIPEWNWSHRRRTIHFVDKSRDKILVAEPPSYISIYDIVAIVVSKILEAPSILPIGPLLACPDGSEKAVLIAVKLGSNVGLIKESNNNILAGKELLPQDALQVQLLPMRPFYRGEIVAWKPGKEGEKLRYGIVSEDVRPSSGQAIHNIPLEIAPGVLQALLSTQVFSFKSVFMGNVTYMSSLPESSQVTSENLLLNVQENKDGGNGKVEQQTARELRYGEVSAEETVRAVHDMLLTAGINMDTEQQTLLRTTLTLQEQIKEFQVALLAEQEKAETAGKEANTAKAAWSCRVCLSSEVDTAIVPCGHVLCYKCCAEVYRCPFCRCLISDRMKIFRP